MRSIDLIKEIRENLNDYPIMNLKKRANNNSPNNIFKKLTVYNYNIYKEIYSLNFIEDFDIENKLINNIKNDIDFYFSVYDPYDIENREFTKYIVLYLVLIAKKPIHPFTENPKDEIFKKDDKYYCKSRIIHIKEERTLCKYCICKNFRFNDYY